MNRHETGRIGEKSAVLYLEEHGYTVIGTNVRVGHDEIDIIAENDEYTVFAEVKTRRQYPDTVTEFGTPASAVDEKKQANIIRAVERYLEDNPTEKTPRIDIIEIYTDPDSLRYKVLDIRHLENAVQKRGKFSRNPRKSTR